MAQTFVRDSLIIAFGDSEKITLSSAIIDSIVDKRGFPPRLIKISEKKKYLIIPIDLYILTQKPIASEILNFFSNDNNNTNAARYTLQIDEFSIYRRKHIISSGYVLNASIGLYNNQVYRGRLLYETFYPKPFFGSKMEKAYENVIKTWQDEFTSDMISVTGSFANQDSIVPENFNTEIITQKKKNLYLGLDTYFWKNSLIVDGEIIFSHREVSRKFLRSGYGLRYRNEEKFEAIQFGLSSDYLFFRLNKNFIFRGKYQLMYGFNKWKDIDETPHEIWDIAIFSLSLSQGLFYDPIYNQSLIFGIGVLEDSYFIESRGLEFMPAILIHIGLKL